MAHHAQGSLSVTRDQPVACSSASVDCFITDRPPSRARYWVEPTMRTAAASIACCGVFPAAIAFLNSTGPVTSSVDSRRSIANCSGPDGTKPSSGTPASCRAST